MGWVLTKKKNKVITLESLGTGSLGILTLSNHAKKMFFVIFKAKSLRKTTKRLVFKQFTKKYLVRISYFVWIFDRIIFKNCTKFCLKVHWHCTNL